MKTIALKEKTFQILEDLKMKVKSPSFDKLISKLVEEKEKIPDSMRGSLKRKSISFTNKERKKLWGVKRP